MSSRHDDLMAHLLAHMQSSQPETAKDISKDGVDRVIDYLVANRGRIGGLVVAVAPKAGGKIINASHPGQECDQELFLADRVMATNQEERHSVTTQSYLTRGMIALLNSALG